FIPQEFGVGENRCERVAQIVGYRSSGAADRRELLAGEKLLLGPLQVRTHVIESSGQFRNFIARSIHQRITEIAGLESAHTLHQIRQWLGEGIRNQEHHRTAAEYSDNTQQE